MTFGEHISKDYIQLNPDYEFPVFGTDQAFISYPVRFATVTFQLEANDYLCNIADQIREKSGYPSIYDSDGDGYYEFYININSFSKSKVDSCIGCYVYCPYFEDDGELYNIDLSEDEQRIVFDALDRQCRQLHGISCDELLEESSKRMED